MIDAWRLGSQNLALVASVTLYAQSAASSEPVPDTPQRVEVSGERSTLLFPYQRAYDTARLVQEHGKGDVALLLRFVPKRAGARVDDIRLRLEYDGGNHPIEVDKQGAFRLEPDELAAQRQAQFVINKRREDYGVRVDLAPLVDTNGILTVGRLHRVIDHGLAVRKALMPWYARAVMPTVGGIRICVPAADVSVQVALPGQAPSALPYEAASDSPPGKPHCADIARSNTLPADSTVLLPPQANIDYYGSLF